jgi:hypothetical protein
LIFLHELKDRLAIPLFLICQIDVDNLLSLKGKTKTVFLLLVSLTLISKFVVLAEGSVLHTKFFFSLFNLNPSSLFTVCRCLSDFFKLSFLLLLAIFFLLFDSFEVLDSFCLSN